MLSKEKWRIVRARLRMAFPLAVILTLLIGSWAVHNTPTTGQLEPPGWTMSFYASLQFFALGASGMPLEPKALSGAVYLLVMFLAPVLLGGSAADFIFEFLRSFGAIQREVDHLRNHVVICGLGTHGRGFARVARAEGCAVVGIVMGAGEGSRMQMPSVEADRLAGGHQRSEGLHVDAPSSVPVLHGDMRDIETLRRAGMLRARSVVFATGDPLTNLKAMLAARSLLRAEGNTKTRLLLLDDGDFKESTEPLMGKDPNIVPVNRYVVAEPVIEALDLDAILSDPEASVAVIGLGRLGRAICQQLLKRQPGEGRGLVLVDPRSSREVDALCEQAKTRGWDVGLKIEDGAVWAANADMLSRSWHIVIAIDNDVAALQVHGVLHKKQAHGTLSGTLSIVLRVVDDQLAEELEAHTGGQSVEVMGIERLVVRSLQSRRDWVAALTARSV